MMRFDPKKVEDDAKKWFGRYKIIEKRIIENREIPDKYHLRIDVQQYFYPELISFWVYCLPVKVEDDARKEIGRWIMSILKTSNLPVEREIDSYMDRRFVFSKNFKDEHGEFEVEFNLVI